jgi:chorismate mutase
VELLNERAQLAADVGRVKGEADSPVLRIEREAEVVRKVAGVSQGPLSAAALANVFREIMSACRALERPLTVAFLGPAGTFLGNGDAQAVRHQRDWAALRNARRGIPRDRSWRC